ncbi:MAG TPA: cobalt ECF transporter T component CbiQ [Syntrophales bacterium]|nr:cobalt ECF transporter T component CbiQ [Syntrophales bacterium]
MKNKIPDFLLSKPSHTQDVHKRGTIQASYIGKGMKCLSEVITTGFINTGQETAKGLFRNLDPRVKVLFLIFFVITISLKRDIFSEVIMASFMLLMVAVSHIDIRRFYLKIIVLTFFFGFLISFPAALNVVTPGEVVLPVFELSHSYDFWIYHIPREIGLTRQGIDGVIMLCLRVMNSLTVSLLVFYTTPFHKIIRALQIFRIPDAFLLIITLSYKYIFIFAKTMEDMYLARKSRLVGMLRNNEAGIWVAGRMAYMFRKTMSRYEEVFRAMVSRGFTEEVKISDLGKLGVVDGLAGCFFLIVMTFILWI